MLKRIFSVMLTLCMFLSIIPLIYADYETPPVITSYLDTVTITGTAKAGDRITVLVSEEETQEPVLSQIYLMKETLAGKDGRFEFKFKMPSKKKGSDVLINDDYYVRIGSSSTDLLWTVPFRYEAPISKLEGTTKINECIDASAVTTWLDKKTSYDLFHFNGVLMDEYNMLSNDAKEAISAGIFAKRPLTPDGFSDFVIWINKQIIPNSLSEAETVTDLKTRLNAFGSFFGVFSNGKYYENLTDNERIWIAGRMLGEDYPDFTTAESELNATNGLYLLFHTSSQVMHSVFGYYKNIFEITQASYDYVSNLNPTNRNKFYSIFQTDLSANSSAKKDGINGIYNSSLNKYKNSGDGGGGGGGGGGSSYKKDTTEIILPSPSPDELQPEYKKDNSTDMFDDLNSVSWASAAVNALANKGFVRGVAPRTFEPDRNITRAEYLKILLTSFNMAVRRVSDIINYGDVVRDDWYYYYVICGTELGIVRGGGDGNFEPNRIITREEMAVMLYRVCVYQNVGFHEIELDKQYFSDQDQISEGALESVQTLYRHQIIKGMGDGTFAPLGSATRAEAAHLVYTMLKSINWI